MVITRKRTHNTINVNMRKTEIESSRSIKYLGLQIDPKLQFKEHVKIATAKASKTAQNLAKIIPNVGTSKSAKRRLFVAVVMF